MNSTSPHPFLEPCSDIARDAGRLIMTYFAGHFTTQRKEDKSPVTDADVAANTLIVNALNKLTPDIPIIAEEDEEQVKGNHEFFWLVDPLDGTRAFVKGEPEFTVNIGLIHNRQPLLGVIYAPPQEQLYYGQVNFGSFRSDKGGAPVAIQTRKPEGDGMVVVCSKSHPSARTTSYLETIKVKQLLPGSSSIKLCMVADGSADLYPRFGRTMEWDTAAGHAILNAAGGRLTTETGEPLLYGKPTYENPGFIAYGQ